MERIYSLSELSDAHSLDYPAVRRLVRSGDIVRIRRGAYLFNPDAVQLDYLAHVRATWRKLEPGSVLSHESAAVLHGLPLWRHTPSHITITRNDLGHGRVRRLVHVRRCALPPDQQTIIDGMTVTSLARTAVDLARLLPFEAGVAVLDRALAIGCARDELSDVALTMPRWPGIGKVVRGVPFADPRSESPAESVSRVQIDQAGLPAPEPQFCLYDAQGRLVGRFDFGWQELRLLGECDGASKYDERASHGVAASELVLAVLRRDRAAQELGWRLVHWGTTELGIHGVLGGLLRRAYDFAA